MRRRGGKDVEARTKGEAATPAAVAVVEGIYDDGDRPK